MKQINNTKSELHTIASTFRIIALVFSVICIGLLFYEMITASVSLLSIMLLPVSIISSIIAIVIPSKRPIKYVHKYLTSFIIWIITILITIGCLYIYNKVRNLSPVIYAVEFYWEEGIYMDFRENGTFKARNEDLVGGSISYGNYKKVDSLLILMDEVKFGMSKLKDTLIIQNKGITFTLEKPWREINQATMIYSRAE